jgi:phospholipid-translocating ATPase
LYHDGLLGIVRDGNEETAYGTMSYGSDSMDEVAHQLAIAFGFSGDHGRKRIELQTPNGSRLKFDILDIFLFTSESKCMGVVVRDTQTGDITFLQKDADVIMVKIIQ